MNINKKAYCGDGLLRYCLGKIFLSHTHSNLQYTTKLGENRILALIVCKNPQIFGKHRKPVSNSSSAYHHLGTLYEAFIYDILERDGMEGCIKFIKDTFEITEKDSKNAYEVYSKIRSWEQSFISEAEKKTEIKIDSSEYTKVKITESKILKSNDIITTREAIQYKFKK